MKTFTTDQNGISVSVYDLKSFMFSFFSFFTNPTLQKNRPSLSMARRTRQRAAYQKLFKEASTTKG